MATRSLIGYQEPNGSVNYVYCHSDGYLDYNGSMLYCHYPSYEQAKELVSMGGISSLGPMLGVQHDMDGPYGSRPVGGTTFYARDRGEPVDINTVESIDEFWQASAGTEYWYVHDGEQWLYRGGPPTPHRDMDEDAMEAYYSSYDDDVQLPLLTGVRHIPVGLSLGPAQDNEVELCFETRSRANTTTVDDILGFLENEGHAPPRIVGSRRVIDSVAAIALSMNFELNSYDDDDDDAEAWG